MRILDRNRIVVRTSILEKEQKEMESSSFTVKETSTIGLKRRFQPPPVEIIGCYSTDSTRNYIDGAEKLRYCQNFEETRRVNYNLCEGIDYEGYRDCDLQLRRKRKEQISRNVHLLKWINLHKDQFEGSRPNFVLPGKMMQKIASTAYRCKYAEYWSLAAWRKNGTIYIQRVNDKQSQDEPDTVGKYSAWGYNFEKFVLADAPNESPDPCKKTSQGDECQVVIKTEIGGHSTLYSMHLDGVCAKSGHDLLELTPTEKDQLSHCELVEVKTCSVARQDKLRHKDFQRHQSRAWWLQAALGGVSRIIVGYRDEAGIVKEVETMGLQDLHEYGSGWHGESGYKFLGDFLSEVQKRVVEENKEYKFSFDAKEQTWRGFKLSFEVPVESSEYLLPDLLPLL